MGLNPQQESIVDALEGSMNVAAGAGTGKTFTLTQRIVACVKRMLEEDSEDNIATGRILAITFTTKAAEELRSRVRAALLSEAEAFGDERLARCALEIDNAWISTIHAMASRILKENALTFGIDPSFQVLSADETKAIFELSLDEVLAETRMEADPFVRELLDKVGIHGKGSNSYSVVSMIRALFDSSEYMPSGLAGIKYVEPKASPADLLKRMMLTSQKVLVILKDGVWPDSEEDARAACLTDMQSAIDGAQLQLEADPGRFFDSSFDTAGFLEALFAFPPTTAKFPLKAKEYRDDFSEYRREYRDIAKEALTSIGYRRLKGLIAITERVFERIEDKKRANGTLLSQGDLLRICNDRLSDPRNADIVMRYQDRFRYIMVDEFQDTDKLQMSIIEKLSRKNGLTGHAGLSNLCTVGDMQQSIYRFRGGDVTLAKERSSELDAIQDAQKKLSFNYRSHEAILDAVEMVFAQQDVFGRDFLKLEAKAQGLDETIECNFADRARVAFDILHYSSKRDVPSDLARAIAATRIARHFKELIDGGVAPGKLAILLGRAFTAGIYQRALAAFGIESIVVKGSIFSQTKEAQLVLDLVDIAANPKQGESLFRVLTSELFNVSDDDLVLLCSAQGQNGFSVRSITDGFDRLCKDIEGLQSQDRAIDRIGEARYTDGMLEAAKALLRFRNRARSGNVSGALRRLLVESGYLFRVQGAKTIPDKIEAEDVAGAANINKAINILKGIEAESAGIAEVALGFAGYLEMEKETPGMLALGNADFVQIITVHSSKGLEYDHVAVAELKDGIGRSSRFIVENCGEKTLVAMRALDSEFDDPQTAKVANKVCAFTFDDDETNCDASTVEAALRSNSTGTLFDAIARYSNQQDFDEARRLLYVAMTRAKETLFVSHIDGAEVDRGYKGIYDDIDRALQEHFSFSDSVEEGSIHAVQMPIEYSRVRLSGDTLDDEDRELASEILGIADVSDAESADPSADGDDIASFIIPVFEELPDVDFEISSIGHEGVFSYTSLSRMHDSTDCKGLHEDEEVPQDAYPVHLMSKDADPVEEPRLSANDSDKATNLGTAFHRLAQLSILQSDPCPQGRRLICPDEDRINAQVSSCNLSDMQIGRLRDALDLWFESDECRHFASIADIFAEVPFAVKIDAGNGEAFILEGEIDGLGIIDGKGCLFIDYKTGGSASETYDSVHEKHLLQAQCYAYALMSNGFDEVEAHFIRVEQRDPQDLSEPQIMKYSFSIDDIDVLHDEIIAAYRYSVEQDG